MMDGRCATCRWWARDEEGGIYDRIGDPVTRPTFRPCLRARYRMEGCDDPNSKAMAYDGEDYMADLLTAPDFGCVQWEKREE